MTKSATSAPGLKRRLAVDELIERLRERAEFEDKRVLDEAKALGFVPEAYTGSQTGALLREAAAALEAAREDGERYRWLRRKVSAHGVIDGWTFAFPTHLALPAPASAMRDPAGGLDAAIDQARGKAGQEVGE